MSGRRWALAALLLGLLCLGGPTAALAATSTLVTSAARTSSGNSGLLTLPTSRLMAAICLLTVTAAATEAGDTLDVYLQSSLDAGVTFDDFVHFTQVLGNGGAKKFLAYWHRDSGSPSTAMKVPQDGALAPGVQQGPLGPDWRVKWVIVDVATFSNQSFTFSVSCNLIEG